MPEQSTPGSEFFNDTWSIYEQVLLKNHMFHDEIYTDIEAFLAARFGNRQISVLDLGCGDARYLSRALQARSISTFLGYDLSAAALTAAKANLLSLGAELDLREGDLLEGIQSAGQGFDLIFSSFALHHLNTDNKSAFFQAASKRLNESGVLILVDVMRDEDENLALYLDRYCGWLKKHWTSLPTPALDMVCEHILHNDLPETVPTLIDLAGRAGLDSHKQINAFGWHRTLSFDKAA